MIPRQLQHSLGLCLVMLLVPWQQHSSTGGPGTLIASAQGLAATPGRAAQIEASAKQQADSFAEMLQLSRQLSSPGTVFAPTASSDSSATSSLMAMFSDPQTLQQLQSQVYTLAGAPQTYQSDNRRLTPGGLNLVPRTRDQGPCATGVSHAVAAAAEAAIAATLRMDADKTWPISAQSLHYCSEGGKTCAVGWASIGDALSVLKASPQLVRNVSCGLNNAAAEPQVGSWEGACTAAAERCSYSNARVVPWLSCSYKQLTSHDEIQSHIRRHGTVVTAINIYDDFKGFFSPSGRPSAEYGAYRVSPGAQRVFSHAGLIVGYDNLLQTWTMQNSWGKCVGAQCGATPFGTTSDGLFKIAMGEAGVASPDETFGVLCQPEFRPELDPHHTQPWRAPRKPVKLVKQADRNNLLAACYRYDAQQGETSTSIAADFKIDIRSLALGNTQLFRPATIKATFSVALSSNQLQTILSSVQSLTQPGLHEPYVMASSNVQEEPTMCDKSNTDSCSSKSTYVLHYAEPNVATSPADRTLGICGISAALGQFDEVAWLPDPRESQPRALRALLDSLGFAAIGPVPDDYCDPAAWALLSSPDPSRSPAFAGTWVGGCDTSGYVTSLDVNLTAAGQPITTQISAAMLDALLVLERLESLRLVVGTGSELPPQLGALESLSSLTIEYACMGGSLPTNYGLDWKGITRLKISQLQGVPPAGSTPDCGAVSGSIPQEWMTNMPRLQQLDLSTNALQGTIPAEGLTQMAALHRLSLRANQFEGQIPGTLSLLSSLEFLDLSKNNLQGVVPLSLQSVQATLTDLVMDDNAGLQGCIPLAAFTRVSYLNTGITGRCSAAGADLEDQQRLALRDLLGPLLNADPAPWATVVRRFVADAKTTPLRQWLKPGESSSTISYSDKRGSCSLTLDTQQDGVFVTAIQADGAGLDLSLLAAAAAALPRLQSFACDRCTYNAKGFTPAANMLPPGLASKAGTFFTDLAITNCGDAVKGGLPEAWGSWRTIQKLNLAGNKLSGAVPGSWATMRGLNWLSLASNQLSGPLPDLGLGPLPDRLEMDFSNNPGLSGSIPGSFARFTGSIRVSGTNVFGCVPDQLLFSVFGDSPNVPCSEGSPQVQGLLGLKQVLDQTGQSFPTWEASTAGSIPGLSGAPGYCRRWLGVKCDMQNQVSELDLSSLTSTQGLAVLRLISLQSLIPHLLKLPGLQVLTLAKNPEVFKDSSIPSDLYQLKALRVLDLSASALAGSLPSMLAGLSRLQHLNVSTNPGLTGSLPELLGGLTSLQVLDVSRCGFGEGLPMSWAAMQSLRFLSASGNKPGISGTIPDAYGLLQNLRTLDLSFNRLSGTVPRALGDATSAAKGAVEGAKSGLVVPGPSPSPDTPAAPTPTPVPGFKVPGFLVPQPEPQPPPPPPAETPAAPTPTPVPGFKVPGFVVPQPEPQPPPPPVNRIGFAAAASVEADTVPANACNVAQAAAARAIAALEAVVSQLQQVAGQTEREAAGAAAGSLTPQRSSSSSNAVVAQSGAVGLLNLQYLNLQGNSLSGEIPSEIAVLPLRWLVLSDNKLSGALPDALAGMPRLQRLLAANNQLSGELPAMLGRLSSLSHLDVSGNQLAGQLPDLWAGMTRLEQLMAGNNRLSGSLPAIWFGLRNLQTLSLPGNLLSGVLPKEFGLMADATSYSLRRIDLKDNPCMAQQALRQSIKASGITKGGRVKVDTGCCSAGIDIQRCSTA